MGAPTEERRLASYPGMARGWYCVGHATDIPRGAVRRLGIQHHDLAVFRGADNGKVGVLHGHCPHLGAHFAEGGEVEGDVLVCPFHRWAFDAHGALRHVPYDPKPPRVKASCYAVREMLDHVFVWLDDKGSSDPDYELGGWDEVLSGRARYRGRRSPVDVAMHLVEFAENAVDTQHFTPLHGRMQIPWTSLAIPGLTIDHTACWTPDDAFPWVSHFDNQICLRFRGRNLERTRASARVTLDGPGSVARFTITIPQAGSVYLLQAQTPVEPLKLRVWFCWWSDRGMPRPLAWYVVGTWVAQWRADVRVWANKVYRPKPVLSRRDGDVHALRRWYRQFECEG